MTIHVKPEEIIKIEEGTIFYRVKFQGQWSRRLHPNPIDRVLMPIVEGGKTFSVEAFKFDGEKREHYAKGERTFHFPLPVGFPIEIILRIKSTGER